jgi:hypothetical protein
MSLLEEIQNDAVGSSQNLSEILRKVKLLAARLGNEPLAEWIIWESNGYPDDVTPPDYRIWPLVLKGHFWGPFGSRIENAPVPLGALPDQSQKKYQKYKCRMSIAALEQFNQGLASVRISTGDLNFYLKEFYVDHQCIQVWGEFSEANITEVLNSVRNRVLDFSLALWREYPDAGAASKDYHSQIPQNTVTQIFNNTVFSGNANIVGSSISSNILYNIIQGDFDSLKILLQNNGVLERDIEELRECIKDDPKPTEKEKFGPRVSGWIGKMTRKAADGTWQIAINAVGGFLGQALWTFYGL